MNPVNNVSNNHLTVENQSSIGTGRRKVSVIFNYNNSERPDIPINVMLSLNEKD